MFANSYTEHLDKFILNLKKSWVDEVNWLTVSWVSTEREPVNLIIYFVCHLVEHNRVILLWYSELYLVMSSPICQAEIITENKINQCNWCFAAVHKLFILRYMLSQNDFFQEQNCKFCMLFRGIFAPVQFEWLSYNILHNLAWFLPEFCKPTIHSARILQDNHF